MVGEMNKTLILWVGGAAAAAGIAYAFWREKKEGVGYLDNVRITEGDPDNNVPGIATKLSRSRPTRPRVYPYTERELVDEMVSVPDEKDSTKRVKVPTGRKLEKDFAKSANMYAPDSKKYPWKPSEVGSPIFTSTTKLRAPSWGLEAGHSCPAMRIPIRAAMERFKQTGLPETNQEIAEEIIKSVPPKCLNCYAATGNYTYPSTITVQQRRINWFDNTPEAEVIDTLVDAIKHAGDTQCGYIHGKSRGQSDRFAPKAKRGASLPQRQGAHEALSSESKIERRGDERKVGTAVCKFTPMVQPKYFRLFDSGDFHNERAARIWYEVIRKVNAGPKKTKFWVPTTAHEAQCADDPTDLATRAGVVKWLTKMAVLPNVAVRVSATVVNHTAPEVFPGHRGSAITDDEDVHETYVQNTKKMRAYGRAIPMTTALINPDGKTTTKHWVCPGDCSICRKCWNKDVSVVYPLHGHSGPPEKAAIRMLARTFSASQCLNKEHINDPVCLKQDKDVQTILQRAIVTLDKIGPGSVEDDEEDEIEEIPA
jgi:hypothetical protein